MPQIRSLLILAGLAVAVWETVDIFWISTPAAAAVFAGLFFACTIWYWRHDSARAAAALLILFAIEGLAAPFLKHVMLVTKVCAIALGLTGFALAALVLMRRRYAKPTAPNAAA
jgi:hypothetical protein